MRSKSFGIKPFIWDPQSLERLKFREQDLKPQE